MFKHRQFIDMCLSFLNEQAKKDGHGSPQSYSQERWLLVRSRGDDGESPELPAENNLHGWSVEAGMLEQNKHLQSIFHAPGALAEHLHSIILITP